MADHPMWYWKTNLNPWSTEEIVKWDTYSDIENEIIEDAYTKKLQTVEIDDYIIDLKQNIQISKIDKTKQRPIKRVVRGNREPELLRRDRFFLPTQSTNIPSFRPPNICKGQGSEFIDRWKMDVRSAVYDDIPQVLELAATGIAEEGAKLGKQCEAAWIADSLRNMKEMSESDIYKHCAWLYTRECFLYKLLNQCLREHDVSKISTLGPFTYLLHQYLKSETSYGPLQPINKRLQSLVYRGGNLTPEMINCYKIDECGHWPAFTSTTKNRSKAENFGNTLFIIDLTSIPVGADLASISSFPEEEEILLSATTCFFITNIEKSSDGKTLIYLRCIANWS
ncbi:unnamed protein product [Rotaria magnacalcarata]